MLEEDVRRKSATAGSLDGWEWRELIVLLIACLARILSKIVELGVWPEGLLDAKIAMIPNADGDASPLGQRTLGVLPAVYRILVFAGMVRMCPTKDFRQMFEVRKWNFEIWVRSRNFADGRWNFEPKLQSSIFEYRSWNLEVWLASLAWKKRQCGKRVGGDGGRGNIEH